MISAGDVEESQKDKPEKKALGRNGGSQERSNGMNTLRVQEMPTLGEHPSANIKMQNGLLGGEVPPEERRRELVREDPT